MKLVCFSLINNQELIQRNSTVFLKEKPIPIVFTAINALFSNGINERFNQTLVNKIRYKINEGKKKVAWTTIAQ